MLQSSNENLNQLKRDLDGFAFDKEDLRYEVYKLITDVMYNNITLRQHVNEL